MARGGTRAYARRGRGKSPSIGHHRPCVGGSMTGSYTDDLPQRRPPPTSCRWSDDWRLGAAAEPGLQSCSHRRGVGGDADAAAGWHLATSCVPTGLLSAAAFRMVFQASCVVELIRASNLET